MTCWTSTLAYATCNLLACCFAFFSSADSGSGLGAGVKSFVQDDGFCPSFYELSSLLEEAEMVVLDDAEAAPVDEEAEVELSD